MGGGGKWERYDSNTAVPLHSDGFHSHGVLKDPYYNEDGAQQ